MVITRIKGGLGNQMFQYACGRAVSEATGSQLKLDLSWFDEGASYSHDSFFLSEFDIQKKVATQTEIHDMFLLGEYGKRFADFYYNRLPQFFQTAFNYYSEVPSDHSQLFSHGPVKRKFYPELLNTTGNCYLDGYWTSEKYFANQIVDISDQLRDELSLQRTLTGKNQQTANSIRNTTSVSLHDRRRDFVDHGWDLDIDYYTEAINRIASNVSDFELYIFSDDISWLKDNLDIDCEKHFMTDNDVDDCVIDMQLMSLCDHNIISGSTFSWWGAWLNSNENKQVIAPKNWCGSNVQQTDVIPDNWEILST